MNCARLLANGATELEADHVPVVKLFKPIGTATWLLTELDADGDTLFGLCDLGFGFPNSAALKGPLGPVAGGNCDDFALASVFARLLTLPDDDVASVLALVMAETLGVGSAIIEALGNHLGLDMRAHWQADGAFFELLRDRQVANAMLADVGGSDVADGNASEKVKTQKKIMRDFLAGEKGRQQIEGWLPRWLNFPVESYTDRGRFRTADQWTKVRSLFVSE
ncbi:DUF2958 domain-containing protein [Mesorhizobium sp. M8A.F.Ca.ET.165.01.1.1]|nr:DUF2958 domain-containing protein [Mesorhizobium sp. M8A.F.Ca.ET.165.01.1.1]TIS47474.1 MAG: DUF2958 domain-containing protein [Mesorhizobium sp.]